MILLPGRGKGAFASWHAPRVLALVADAQSGCALWRVLLPFSELQRQGAPVGAAEWGYNDLDATTALLPRFDAALLPRLSWRPRDRGLGEAWVDLLHRHGKRVWYEIDDDLFTPWLLPQITRGGGLRAGDDPAQLEQEREGRLHALSLCDGVVVSSQRLATVVRTLTAVPVEVVPNFADWRWFRRVRGAAPPRAIPPLTVGWAGGARPDADVQPLAWAWGELARRRPAVTFVVQGHQPAPLHTAVPPERLRAIGWLPVEQYLWGLVNVDVACCPLADAPFNRCKSGVKAMEAGAVGAAVVASPTVYRQVITHGEDGYVCESGEEWLGALQRLVDDQDERRRVAGNLRREVAARHSLEANVWRHPAAWTRLWEGQRD